MLFKDVLQDKLKAYYAKIENAKTPEEKLIYEDALHMFLDLKHQLEKFETVEQIRGY